MTRKAGPRWPSGTYVIDFGDRIKVGRADDMQSRIQMHRKSGAVRFTIFPAEDVAVGVERETLRLLRSQAEQIRRTESFRRVEYGTVVDLMRMVLNQQRTRWANLRANGEGS